MSVNFPHASATGQGASSPPRCAGLPVHAPQGHPHRLPRMSRRTRNCRSAGCRAHVDRSGGAGQLPRSCSPAAQSSTPYPGAAHE